MNLLKKYGDYKSQDRCQSRTIQKDGYIIGGFLNYVDDNNLSLEAIKDNNIIGWLSSVKSKSSRKSYLTILKTFYKWLANNNGMLGIPNLVIPNFDIAIKVYKNKIREIPTLSDISEYIKDTNNPLRIRSLVAFLSTSGVRIAEATRISRNNIDSGFHVTVINGKGGKDRYTTVSVFAFSIMEEWRKQRNTLMYFDYSSEYLSKLLKKETGFSAHLYRHFFCTNNIDSGVDIEKVSKMMGHENVGITKNIYYQLSPKAIDGVNGIYKEMGI